MLNSVICWFTWSESVLAKRRSRRRPFGSLMTTLVELSLPASGSGGRQRCFAARCSASD